MGRQYAVNEVFFSLQGEGVRMGTPNVFIRFQGCNLRCEEKEGPKSPGGFDCDTEFMSGRKVSLDELGQWCATSIEIALGKQDKAIYEDGLVGGCDYWKEPWIILTGGEPGLQVDKEFCDYWHQRGVKLAIETNGTIELPYGIVGDGVVNQTLINEGKKYRYHLDWITVSPKVAEHAIKQKWADEVKYVRGYGQGIPKTVVEAPHRIISPAFDGNLLDHRVLEWCIHLCQENPEWRLSVQSHKAWQVR